MAVVIETTLGDITVDLYLEQRPVTCLNFLKLCKMKYYNYNLFHTIRSDFIAQTGDPTGGGSGGESIWGILEGPQKRFFSGEKMPKIRHTGAGLLSMVCTNDMMVGSQFFFTLAPDLDSLDGTHCVIGEVTEGHEILTKLNEVICDESNRPYRDVRITHTVVLEDPFNDPPGLRAPSRSPSPSAERLKGGRIAPDEEIDETQGKSVEEVQEMIEEKEAKARATILEIVGDLPDADIAPPENVLFVCKLNPVTSDDDLEIIFSRFGKIVNCEVIRDKKTGNSLQYAFIEFENKNSCEEAYFKMDNVLIDDRRIHVDFSQSVSKMRYLGKGRVQFLNDEVIKNPETKRNRDDRKDRNDDISSKHSSDNRRQNKVSRSSRHDRDLEQRGDREKAHKRRYKSRSRSSSRNKSRERVVKNGEKSDHRKGESHRYRDSDSYRRRTSPFRQDKNNSKHSPHRHSDSILYREERRNHDKKLEKNYNSREEDSNRRSLKRKESESLDRNERNKKTKHNHIEPNTPSPKASNKKDKNSKKKDKRDIKNSTKRKHKKSTSSESESSDSSSSSSDSSSSSESDGKRNNKAKRRRRKYSTSSSSDSSSTGSSSSSGSSSDSSSSSSDSEPSKKSAKKDNNKSKKNKRK